MIRAGFARLFVAARRRSNNTAPHTAPQSEPISASRTTGAEGAARFRNATRFGERSS
jgi:hypothetical protein